MEKIFNPSERKQTNKKKLMSQTGSLFQGSVGLAPDEQGLPVKNLHHSNNTVKLALG